MFTVYHNPKCRKSRAGLQYLIDNNIEYSVVEYIKNPITQVELKQILVKLNKKPVDVLRTQEDVFKEQFKGKNFTDEEWVQIICENPKLLQRPIVVGQYKAVIADPSDEIDRLIK
jgi:arsenate reductase (glutaredoxin)